MSSESKSNSSDTQKLIPILVIVGVLMCGCIALPVVGGIALFGFIGMRAAADREREMVEKAMAEDAAAMHEMAADFGAPEIPGDGLPSDFGGGQAGGAKQAAYQEMLAAEQALLEAQAAYEGAQAVYEQQRNTNNAQAGRLGAQGIRLPPPQQPDPSLYQAVLAAQARYEQAKAQYDALP